MKPTKLYLAAMGNLQFSLCISLLTAYCLLPTVSFACAPVANFIASDDSICVGQNITFMDQSTNTPTSWSWTLPGGTPATSTVQNPVVTYNTAGTYNVSLTATNSNGSGSSTKNNYINVIATGTPITVDLCQSDSACGSVTIDAGISGGAYTWSNGATTQAILAINSGTYSVTASQCSSPPVSDSINVSIFPVPCCNYSDWQWQRQTYHSGVGYRIMGNAICVDYSGYSYVTGTFSGQGFSTIGVLFGSYLLTGSQNAFVAKYDPAGNVVWAVKLTNEQEGTGIAIDSAGNIYVAGYGSGYTFFAKYNMNGNNIWTKTISTGANNINEVGKMAIDDSENIYITGNFWNTVDFDPGAGIANLTAGGLNNHALFFAKYDSNGNYLMAQKLDVPSNNIGNRSREIVVDTSGNIFITGGFVDGLMDFDPGAGVANLFSSYPGRAFIAKYDNNGNYGWAVSKGTGGTVFSYGEGLFLDNTGNLYYTGKIDAGSPNYNSLMFGKYTNSGTLVFEKILIQAGGNSSSSSNSIALDGCGNIFITGRANGGTDFDPSAGTVNISGAYLAKYDNNGNYLWWKNPLAEGNDVTTDAYGNVYVTGGSSNNAFTSKIGHAICFVPPPTPPTANFTANPTTVCEGDMVIFTDQTTNTPTLWSWTFAGGTPATSTSQNPTVTYSTPGTYDVTLIATNADGTDTLSKTNYINVLPDSLCGGSSGCNESIPATVQNNPATVQNNPATVQNNPATTETTPATIQNNPASIVTVLCLTSGCTVSAIISGDTVICNGDSTTLIASGGTSYLWNTGDTTAIISVNPSTTTNYYAIATTDTCVDTAYVTVTVNTNPAPTITAGGPTTFCAGDSVLLTASAAASYSWSTGATLQSITATDSGIYTVTITDSNACSGTASDTVIVNSPPVAIITGDTDICVGDTTTLVASGGISFQWSTGETGDSIQVSPASPTSYSLTVTDNNGCTNDTTVTVTLSPNPSVALIGPSTMCNGDSASLIAGGGVSYQWSTGETSDTIWVTPATTTTYIVTVTDADGCSDTSVITITIDSAIVAVITGDSSLCNGDSSTLTASGGSSFLWSTGSASSIITVIPSSDSIFSVTVTSASCSDSTNVTVIVNPNPAAIINSSADTICQGSAVILAASGGTNYQWSTGAINDTITVAPSSDSTFYVTVTNSFGCDSIDEATITVKPTATVTASATICQTDSIFLQNSWQTAAGTYYDTLTSTNGCDSIIVTDLIVNPKYFNTFSASICQGDSIYVNGFWLNTAGTYYDSLLSLNGCDSIQELQLAVFPTATATASANICNGDSAFLQGAWQSTAGTYYDTLISINGCDSILATTLLVNSIITIPLTAAICVGDSIFLQDNYQTTAGTYYDTLTAANGCDSILATTLSVDSAIFNLLTASICPGDSAQLPGGNWVNSAGVYYDTLAAGAGCDSIIQTTLSVNISYNIPLNASICTGDSIFLQGNYQSAAGTYYDTLTSINGCDSILAITLSVDSAIFNSVAASLCPGDSIQLPSGNWANTAGVYSDTLTTIAGCDSIIQTTLSLNSTYNIPLTASICTGDSIFLLGSYQTSAGTYYDTLSSVNGCDSILATTLTVTPPATATATATICNGDSIFLQNNYQTAAGTYNDTLIASNGCDSILTTSLSVNNNITIPLTASICSGDSIFLDSSWQTTQGIYYDTLSTMNGCDSIKATTLTVNPVSSVQYPVSICNGDSLFLQNAWQTNAGTYYDTLVASSGCDSVVTATLAVNPTATATATATLCQGDSVLISGEWVNVAGTYYDSLLTASGCDSIIAINLSIDSMPVVTIGNDTTITSGISIQIVASGGISYLWGNGETSPGITVSPGESTTYYVTVSDANGCAVTDSVKITVDISKCTVFVPTIFTPNGDGKNDVLYVRGYGLKELEFMIYDRWGEKVFEYSGSPLPSGGAGGGPGWDGTFQKKEMNTAVFVYMLKAVCFNNELIEEKGNITLVK